MFTVREQHGFMIRNPEIVETALSRLADAGIQGNWHALAGEVDGELNLVVNGAPFHAFTEVKRELRQYQLPQLRAQAQQHFPFIVIAENIFPSIKEQLRAQKIAYLDAAGNLFINTGQTYVWIDGRKGVKTTKPVTNRAFTKVGLKTVFCLLQNPVDINLPYRQLAQKANVALGNIQNVLAGLNASGFILQKNKQEKILQQKKILLRRWIDGYRETLKPALHLGTYRFWNNRSQNNWQQLPLPEDANAVWGAQAAAEKMTGYLKAAELTLYVENKSPLITAWTLIPDRNGPVQIYQRFWQDDDSYNNHLAPPLLVYADLLLTDDPRCIEIAETIYKQLLEYEFESD